MIVGSLSFDNLKMMSIPKNNNDYSSAGLC